MTTKSNHKVCPVCRDERIRIPKQQEMCMTCERENHVHVAGAIGRKRCHLCDDPIVR